MPRSARTAEPTSQSHVQCTETNHYSSNMPTHCLPGPQGGVLQTRGHGNPRVPRGQQVQGPAQPSNALVVMHRGPAHQEAGPSHSRRNPEFHQEMGASCTYIPHIGPRLLTVQHPFPHGYPFAQVMYQCGEIQYPCDPYMAPHTWRNTGGRGNSWQPVRQPLWLPAGVIAPYPHGLPLSLGLHYAAGPLGLGQLPAGSHSTGQGFSRGNNRRRSSRRHRSHRQKVHQMRLEASRDRHGPGHPSSEEEGIELGLGSPGLEVGRTAGRLQQATSLDADRYVHAGSDDGDSDSLDSHDQVSLRVKRAPAEIGSGDNSRPEVCNSWDWLVELVMQGIIRRLDATAIRAMRSVCWRWRQVVDRNLEVLRPSKAKIHTVITQFPHLTTVDMSACQNVRNRNLSILGRSNLRIKSLIIGQACISTYGKPRITNSALNSIALMRNLHTLTLCDCSAITNNGMMALSTLTGLTSLAVNKCPRISDKGFAVVEHLKLLQSISVYGCVKVTDGLLTILSCLKYLSFLQLGYTKISEEGIAQLRKFPALADVRFFAEDNITDDSLTKLGHITNLTGLSLACCGDQITGEGLLKLVKSLPRLGFLDLQNCVHVGDDCVAELPKVAKHIDFLQLQGTALGVRGLRALTGLTSLRRLFLDSNHLPTPPNAPLGPHTLLFVSELTQLTGLEIQSRHLPPGLLQAVAKLRKLERLSLSDCDATHGPTAPAERGSFSSSMGAIEKGSTPGFLSLTCCTSLTSLTFQHINVRPKEVALLIEQLPLLSEVQLTDCDGEEELAKKHFPRISLHINTRQIPPASNRTAHVAV